MVRKAWRWGSLIGACLLCACATSNPGEVRIPDGALPDSGLPDGSILDSGLPDSGSPDGGPSDAGNPIPTTDEIQYLDFVLLVDLIDTTGPGAGDAGAIFSLLDTAVASFVAQIGATGDGRTRQLGFMLAYPPWLIDSLFPGKLATVIAVCAQVALAEHVAFHISLETNYFWQTRPDLWNFYDPSLPGYDPANVANVEWTDWSQTGYRWRFADWGAPQNLGAPHMCYLSAKVQSEVGRIGGAVGIAARAAIDVLADAGHPELFSGITVTSEPSLDNYTNIDELDPGIGQLMIDAGAPKVRLGYCAFTAMGFSAANPPADAGAAAAMANQTLSESWASAVAGAGVPTNRLYTHVAAPSSALMLDFSNGPIPIAFIESARPGWTTYPVGPLAADFQPLLDALAAHGNPHWGGTEAAPFDGMGPIDAYDYLRRHYAAGATVVVMNTGATGTLGNTLENAVYSPAAIAAYVRFLGGK